MAKCKHHRTCGDCFSPEYVTKLEARVLELELSDIAKAVEVIGVAIKAEKKSVERRRRRPNDRTVERAAYEAGQRTEDAVDNLLSLLVKENAERLNKRKSKNDSRQNAKSRLGRRSASSR